MAIPMDFVVFRLRPLLKLPKNQTEKCAFHRESHWGFLMLFTAAGSETSHHSVLDAQGTNRHHTGSGVCSIVISQGVPVVKGVGGVCGESFAAAKNLVGFFGSGNSPRKSRSNRCDGDWCPERRVLSDGVMLSLIHI